MKDFLQFFFLVTPFISAGLIYKSRGNALFRLLEALMVFALSFLCIGAIEAGSYWFACVSLVAILFLLGRRKHISRATNLKELRAAPPIAEQSDYRLRVEENIKKVKAIRNTTFSGMKKSQVIYNDNDNIKNDAFTQKVRAKKIRNLIPKGFSNDNDVLYIAFDYEDSKGDRSYREVDVRSFDGERIQAYCHRAKAMRTFIFSRILGDIIIRATGEVKSLDVWRKEIKSLSYKRGK